MTEPFSSLANTILGNRKTGREQLITGNSLWPQYHYGAE
ncbi:hypothetical protein SAMN00120144_2759 [Hymenobacter roseosalivarius DSM 11622]|uniref:Uncharacterized protein n=1 Tax=Hymenobacter roseosalivarius DSM 11622 TaxID=645990 RepID=A0A1W1VSV1_9BACT|nr:hypothetical protein SAMN00120144_2759 [Hymenobacter roseosalivarius DSM 11622]